MGKLHQIANIIIITTLLATIAVKRDGKIFGVKSEEILLVKNDSVSIPEKDKSILLTHGYLPEYTLIQDRRQRVIQTKSA